MMMYRQYTTTGMSKKKNVLFILLWLLVDATSRVQYYIFGGQSVTDTYEYFSYAMIRSESKEPFLSSGLAYAFSENLSGLLKFTGNLIDTVGLCQLLIQILWIILFLIGISMLFGRLVGFVSSGILIVSPWMLKSIFSVSPENYFMLYFSILLIVLGYFHDRAIKAEWHGSIWGRLYLNVAGFFLGMLCIWNYLGVLILLMMIYVLINHHTVLKVRIREQKQEELEEKKCLMGVGSQSFNLLIGFVIGMYATLMKYTGLTGMTIVQQFEWWTDQFKDFPGRCQEIPILLTVWLLSALFIGILCQLIYNSIKKKKTGNLPEDVQEIAAEQKAEAAQEIAAEQNVEAVQDMYAKREPEVTQDIFVKREPEVTQDIFAKREPEVTQDIFAKREPEVTQDIFAKREPEITQDIFARREPEITQDIFARRESETVQKVTAAQEKEPVVEYGREKESTVEEEEGYIVTDDGRKIKLLENPLPVPKKHVKKDIGFDIDDVEMNFDFAISEDDDFDI